MPRGHHALPCPPMLCTGLCTTSGSVRSRVWTAVWESRGRKKVRETYCGTMDRAIRNLSRAPDGGSGRGNPERPRDRSTGRPDNGGPPRPGQPGRGPGAFGSRVRGRRHGGTPSPLTRSHRPGMRRFAGADQDATVAVATPRLAGSWAIDRRRSPDRFAGPGTCTTVAETAPAPAGDIDTTPVGHGATPVAPRPARGGRPHLGGARDRTRGTRSHSGGTATRTRRKAPPRWSSRPHRRSTPAAGFASGWEDPRRGPLELILRGALNLLGRPQPALGIPTAPRPYP